MFPYATCKYTRNKIITKLNRKTKLWETSLGNKLLHDESKELLCFRKRNFWKFDTKNAKTEN